MLSEMISGTVRKPEISIIDEQTCIHIFRQIMLALASVHSKNMAHRDLKTENVIFDKTNGQIKLIDFGFACQTRDKLRQWCGTPAYMSPEIVLKKEYDG